MKSFEIEYGPDKLVVELDYGPNNPLLRDFLDDFIEKGGMGDLKKELLDYMINYQGECYWHFTMSNRGKKQMQCGLSFKTSITNSYFPINLSRSRNKTKILSNIAKLGKEKRISNFVEGFHEDYRIWENSHICQIESFPPDSFMETKQKWEKFINLFVHKLTHQDTDLGTMGLYDNKNTNFLNFKQFNQKS